MTAVVRLEDVTPAQPASTEPVAHVAVLVSLNFPDLDDHVAALVRRFTRVALETLVGLGASYELFDTSTPLADPSRVAATDGLVLLGGGDIDSACYGATEQSPHTYGVDARADRDALVAIAAAEAADLPVLGICRGNQLLNVHRAGTLIPHIADSTLHRGGAGKPMFVDEKIRILPGTRLHGLLGADVVVGRSGHHQAIDTVGDGLRVAALAADGIVEGVEDLDRWLVGVQWHPEDDDGPETDRIALFRGFLDACVERRRPISTPNRRSHP
jgi:putative glutamine amidotransferase